MEINRLLVLAFYTACGLAACAAIVWPMAERARVALQAVALGMGVHQ